MLPTDWPVPLARNSSLTSLSLSLSLSKKQMVSRVSNIMQLRNIGLLPGDYLHVQATHPLMSPIRTSTYIEIGL